MKYISFKNLLSDEEQRIQLLQANITPLLLVKIKVLDFLVNPDYQDDSDLLYGTWSCESIEELIDYLYANDFELRVK